MTEQFRFGSGKRVKNHRHYWPVRGLDSLFIIRDYLGTLLASYIRHPSAIRCFDFNYDHPDRIVCGRSDGCVATWDTMRELMIDEIKPDPDWVQDGVERNLMAWADPERNHTGAITCIRISPSNHLLATGATDNTCKIWNIVSYTKDYNLVQQEERESDRVRDMLDQPIRADEERYNAQIDQRDFRGLKAGEVPLQMGFHADLLHTFRHEGPVMAVRFNNSSSIAITGCIDSTCRLWSIRRGDLLFQINVPAPVTSIFVDAADDMYCACQNRLLFFGIKANIKEEDLPNYWQRRSIKDLTSQLEETPTGGLESHVSPEAAALITQINDEKLAGGIQKMITIPELRNLISHGLVLPTVLDTMLESYPEVNTDKLAENMLKSDITARDVLRLFVNSPFHPRDILAAISAAKDGDGLWAAIKAGAPISQYMLKMGFKNLDELAPGDQKSIFLDFKDFFPRVPGARRARARLPGAPGPDTEYDFYDWSSEDEESYLLEEEMRADYYAARSLPRGKILHFIPSEQIKLLKDYHANRDLKPIFLRDLVLDLNTVSGYPNFNVDAETRDTRPLMAQKAIQRQGVRFNEM
ncbi:WD40-repeat-containing domain protein [Phlyctochytrium arcticum]|nr:WD40-repeat-containing domain protein [Phlyctochytrium arcticum]